MRQVVRLALAMSAAVVIGVGAQAPQGGAQVQQGGGQAPQGGGAAAGRGGAGGGRGAQNCPTPSIPAAETCVSSQRDRPTGLTRHCRMVRS
jgi:hypothetical protein